ncbi:protein kinase domain-containing protein [Nocardiopsis flavescens]
MGGWLQEWLDGRTRLRARTRVGYAEHIDRYLNPYLGEVPLEELAPALVRQAFERISRHTTPRGKPLSSATVQRVRATLRAALNTAVRERLLASNPAKGLRLDGGGSARPVVWTDQAVAEWTHGGARPAVAVWTVEQTCQFLDFVCDHRLYALFHLVVMTGLRRGEVVGLRWEDVDLARGTVGVVRQLQSHPGQGMVESAPKSAASRRTLVLDHTTLGVLRRHRHGQQTEAAEHGLGWDPQGYVFTAVRGGPMAPERLSRLFRELNTASGLPPVRFHDLRHGAATLALAAGVELKVVQAMLGHASIVLTADTYASVLPEVAREAAERMAWLVLRDAGKVRHQVRGRGGRRGLVLASPRSHRQNRAPGPQPGGAVTWGFGAHPAGFEPAAIGLEVRAEPVWFCSRFPPSRLGLVPQGLAARSGVLMGLGQRVGGFRLLRELGSGGFGTVYQGEDASGRRAAVKLLHPHLAKDAQVRHYFTQELVNARRVQGFCLAAIVDADAEADRPWIATEYVEGPTLGEAVREYGPRTGGGLQRLAVQTITALSAIHAAGVVHRDLKPANILLGPDGPRVIDFGIARTLDADTSSATRIGTLGYMAPEQIEGTALGPAADLFAWGAVIIHAATGAEAFPGPTQAARINRVLNHPPETGDLADPLLGIVLECMAKDPDQRPTARQVWERLINGSDPSPSPRVSTRPLTELSSLTPETVPAPIDPLKPLTEEAPSRPDVDRKTRPRHAAEADDTVATPWSREILPFYLVCDESNSMEDEPLQAINDALPELHRAVGGDPEIAIKGRFGIISFHNDAEVLLPLTDLAEVEFMPVLQAKGSGTSYKAVFRLLREAITQDMGRLKLEGHKLYRPAVFFLSGSRPNDDGWEDDYRRLVDPDWELRPDIMAFAFGQTDARIVQRVATVRAFVADGTLSLAEVFSAFLQSQRCKFYETVISREPRPTIQLPDQVEGFTAMFADEL